MPRPYQSVGHLHTEELEGDGWHHLVGATFTLPWGTESPVHFHKDQTYLIRWDEDAQAWEILQRTK